MTKSRVCHDHVVLLLDAEDFESPPAWLTDNFKIIEGGTHAGGSSRNKLIVFKDGTYLELFTWIAKPKEFLAWADKPPGLIDFALTTLAPVTAKENHATITDAIRNSHQAGELGIAYDVPQAGGRKRIDGVDVSWEASRPKFSDFEIPPDQKYLKGSRLDAPFFCHDVTDRVVRVQYDDDSITNHPCGAVGISNIKLVVPTSHLQVYTAFYRALLGTKEDLHTDERGTAYATLEVSVPNSKSGKLRSFVSIYSPDEEGPRSPSASEDSSIEKSAERWLTERGIGIQGLVLHKDSQENSGHQASSLDDHGIGASIFVVS